MVIEGGAIVQAVLLQAVSLGLGAVCIGGFDDAGTQTFVGTDAMPVVFITLGHPEGEARANPG